MMYQLSNSHLLGINSMSRYFKSVSNCNDTNVTQCWIIACLHFLVKVYTSVQFSTVKKLTIARMFKLNIYLLLYRNAALSPKISENAKPVNIARYVAGSVYAICTNDKIIYLHIIYNFE